LKVLSWAAAIVILLLNLKLLSDSFGLTAWLG
jgi:hypothetical protein